MIIKKTSMPSPFPTSNIVGEKKVSDTDVYNCNYVNNINKLSYSEVKTGEIWVDGKPIYRKVVNCGLPSDSTTRNINHGISNIENSWLDVSNSFMISKIPSTGSICSCPLSNAHNGYDQIVNIRNSVIEITSLGNGWANWTIYVAIKYTKTTD